MIAHSRGEELGELGSLRLATTYSKVSIQNKWLGYSPSLGSIISPISRSSSECLILLTE